MNQDNRLYQRVAALSDGQRSRLVQQLAQLPKQSSQQPLQQQHLPPVALSEPASPAQRLVAYVVGDSDDALDLLSLRQGLKDALPPYMVPSVVVPLSSLPRTANGKIDVRALPSPSAVEALDPAEPVPGQSVPGQSVPGQSVPGHEGATRVGARTPVEEILLRIWQRVLRREAIGIYDNFFELGGDSILSIQIVSQAREAGLRLAPNQLFEQPTIAELAAVVNQTVEVVVAQDAVTGPVPLTPIQHWFFEQGMVDPQHWHQALLLELPPSGDLPVDLPVVERAISTLWHHHDALRLRFLQGEASGIESWQQFNADASAPPKVVPVDVAGLSDSEQRSVVKEQGDRLHSGLDLSQGNALQAAYFTRGVNQPSWLLISLHHLVVDAVSWQILQSDLCRLLAPSTPPVSLPAKTTAFKTWADILVAQSEVRSPELSFWLHQLASPHLSLPQEKSAPTQATEGTAHTLTLTLNAAETRDLLQVVPAVYNTQINDVLLTALAHTLIDWSLMGGAGDSANVDELANATDAMLIDVEGHGREQLADDVDLSRTVGWFTAVHPVRLCLGECKTPGDALKTIKEQLRQVPDKGIGYGLLRYLGDENSRQQLATLPSAEVLFNYLGQREAGEFVADIRMIQDLDLGTLRSPANRRNYLLEINTWVADSQLHLNWTYDTRRYQSETILKVARAYLSDLSALIAHCLQPGVGGVTPSDFSDVAISQSELDGLVASILPEQNTAEKRTVYKTIEAIYPLSGLQQAFLWNSLQTSSKAGLLHMRGTLKGELDISLLRHAWDVVVRRHGALRTSIHWDGVREPVQVVAKTVSLPWQVMDWRGREHPRQDLEVFLQGDRALGFDFTQAPIMRLSVIRLSDEAAELIWSCHHLMLDGWSGLLVVNQVMDTYEQLRRGELLTTRPALGYQAYSRWLAEQSEEDAEQFWRRTLQGFSTPTPLPVDCTAERGAAGETGEQRSLALTREESETLQEFLRSHRLTLNTLIQGVWALLLSAYSEQRDVLFGATVSGRQGDLAGVEGIVGMLINVLPVRVQLSNTEVLLSWLRALQTAQVEAGQYAYASPSQIQSWSDCQGRLFNSLLVIENYPTREAEGGSSPSGRGQRTLALKNLRSGIISNYGLTLIVKPSAGSSAGLTLFAEANGADNVTLDALLSDFKAFINQVIETPAIPVDQVIESTRPLSLNPAVTFRAGSPMSALHTKTPPRVPLTKGDQTPTRNIYDAMLAVEPLQPFRQKLDLAVNQVSVNQVSVNQVSVTQPSATQPSATQPFDSATTLPPRTPLEFRLTRIWEAVLGVASLSCEANFFELGGDSLLAVQLFNQMQQQLNCTLPLASLFQAPTIRQLAALLDSEQAGQPGAPDAPASWTSLVPIQTQGDRIPFFFHGGSADALTWARFSRLLGAEQPFYALQRPDLDGRDVTDITVEELATACIRDIKTVQPQGPYVIGGHCFGGAVAYEIAQQLQASGDAIAALIPVDAYCPNALPHSTLGQLQEQLQLSYFLLRKSYYYHGGKNVLYLPKKVWQHLNRAKTILSKSTPAPSNSGPLSLEASLPPSAEPIQSQRLSETEVPYEERYALAHQANIRAAEAYQPQSKTDHYSGTLKIFSANVQILDWRFGPDLGWQKVTQDPVQITTIPGLFGNLFNQRSGPLLAQQVKAYLDTLQ
ncbi:MAG: alpha/beta fold hydrolase [Cyanobacteria bacterium J06598_3]